MAAATLLQVNGLVKRFGGFTALNRVSLDVKQGERFGLIGPNEFVPLASWAACCRRSRMRAWATSRDSARRR